MYVKNQANDCEQFNHGRYSENKYFYDVMQYLLYLQKRDSQG